MGNQQGVSSNEIIKNSNDQKMNKRLSTELPVLQFKLKNSHEGKHFSRDSESSYFKINQNTKGENL